MYLDSPGTFPRCCVIRFPRQTRSDFSWGGVRRHRISAPQCSRAVCTISPPPHPLGLVRHEEDFLGIHIRRGDHFSHNGWHLWFLVVTGLIFFAERCLIKTA